MKNRFEFFTPLMWEHEYKLIEKYLESDDILLEWGTGNGTIYFSGLVKEVISIEHDIDWVNSIQKTIDAYEIDNIILHHVSQHTPDPIPCRYEQFKDYIEYAKIKKFKFDKVLVDGRARKYCAKSIYDIIDDDVIIFVHDFNHNDYNMVLNIMILLNN